MQVVDGVLSGRIGIVASRFHESVVDALLAGALDALKQRGVAENHIDVIRVPGALEIPIACDRLLLTGKYCGLIALGCVVRGETAHFDVVVNESATGVTHTALKYHKPIMNMVLATETMEQALARSGSVGNKGTEAALGLLELCQVLDAIS